jgi:hypothetical protein
MRRVMIWFRPDFSMSLALDEGLASYEAWIQQHDTTIRRRRYRIHRFEKETIRRYAEYMYKINKMTGYEGRIIECMRWD